MTTRTAAWALTLLVAGTWAATTGAQNTELSSGFPALLSDTTAAAIDRGLRENDPPRNARTSPDDRIDRGGSAPDAYVPGSVIVKFRAGTAETARRAMVARISGTMTQALPYAAFDIVAIDGAADAEAVARTLNAMPDVEFAQARYRVFPLFVPNDPLYSRQWNYPAIDMERAWDINPGATSAITVAVIDTGIAYRSALMRYNARAWRVPLGPSFPALGPVDVPFAAAPELGGPERFVAPRDFIWNNTTPMDLDGHGTHVAGTVGQLTNNGVGVAGMAFNVRLMPVKVIDSDWDFIFSSPFVGTDDTVARGIRYAVDNGAQVLNLSIGRSGGGPAPVVQDAIAYAVAHGAFVAVAAGNEFMEGNPVERLAEFAPQIAGMVAVGAIGRNKVRAAYSSTGPFVELTAPGGDSRQDGIAGGILQQTYDLDLVETFLDGLVGYRAPRFDSFVYQQFEGTSMAAPHVSGFAALLMQQGITSPAAIEAAMKQFATDLGVPGRDNEYGNGLINPRASLRGLGLVK